jgi:succinoglycan biosynthesis protein ExoV
MRLYYHYNTFGNFGDDLNPWLFSQLLPGVIDDRDDALLVGIGTILNTLVPAAPRKLVLGSGTGYGDLPKVDEKWTFYAVRGPRTAQRLGLDPSLAVTDGAALLRYVPLPGRDRVATDPPRVAYMPHHASAFLADWAGICRDAGVEMIDPHLPLEHILERMRGASLIIAEAMHGAIVADVLRVPWVPVRIYEHLNEFKWGDWCESVDLTYEPISMPPVYDDSVGRLLMKARLKLRQLKRVRRVRDPLPSPPTTLTTRSDRDRTVAALAGLARGDHATLSTDAAFESRSTQLRECLERLRRDLSARR